MKLITGWISQVRLNFRYEMLAFSLHRITGLGVAIFLLVHIYSLGHRIIDEKSFNDAMIVYDKYFLFHIGEFMLFLSCGFHALNGVRIMLVDFLPLTKRQNEFLFWTVAICALLGVTSLLVFFPELDRMLLG